MGLMVAQGPDVLNARRDAFLNFKAKIIGQVHDDVSSTMTTLCKYTEHEPKSRPILLNLKNFEGKMGENLTPGSLRMAMSVSMF